MSEIVNLFSKFDIFTILAMFAIFWWFSKEFKSEMKSIEEKIDRQGERIDKQGKRIDRLYEMFIDLLKEKKS